MVPCLGGCDDVESFGLQLDSYSCHDIVREEKKGCLVDSQLQDFSVCDWREMWHSRLRYCIGLRRRHPIHVQWLYCCEKTWVSSLSGVTQSAIVSGGASHGAFIQTIQSLSGLTKNTLRLVAATQIEFHFFAKSVVVCPLPELILVMGVVQSRTPRWLKLRVPSQSFAPIYTTLS